MKIGILLPAYNEGKNIVTAIRECRRHWPSSKILVIDDGSGDDTYNIAKRSGAIVLRHENNRGKGEALKTGFAFFQKSDIDCILVVDADMQYGLEDSDKIVKGLEEGYDVVTGYRIPSEIPYANRMGNFAWRSLFNMFFGASFKDTNCGYIGVRREALPKIKHIHGGYIIENSIFADCVRGRLKVRQVPVHVSYGRRKVPKFAKMFFGVLLFIVAEGLKYRIKG